MELRKCSKFNCKEMKKLFFLAIISIATVAGMNAQTYKWWAGGHTTLWVGDAGTTFNFAPEIGYLLSPKITLAASLGYYSFKSDNKQITPDIDGIILNPYVRYTAFKRGLLLGFVDAGVDVGIGDNKGFQVGFKPGIALLLTDRFTAATQFGFIGYNDGKGIGGRRQGIGFDLSGYCPIIAFFYSF
jgi:hypothetical protein